MLNTENLNLGVPRKLASRFIGPFPIVEKLSPLVYKLELPTHFKIHPTFHISKLRPYYMDETFGEWYVQPLPPTLIEHMQK